MKRINLNQVINESNLIEMPQDLLADIEGGCTHYKCVNSCNKVLHTSFDPCGMAYNNGGKRCLNITAKYTRRICPRSKGKGCTGF